MLYNIFNSKTYQKMNMQPLNNVEATAAYEILSYNGGYNKLNSPFVIQGIYAPTMEGYKKFLDDMGWEKNGQNYDSFEFAMRNDELYVN